ncbi:hypothetical protein GQ53DRAFT_745045 [Thozetella sp. PMI_491]|nr:hypothetical protein GQ53DRAFT_745045 [Thozetella sp. PMI_491]
MDVQEDIATAIPSHMTDTESSRPGTSLDSGSTYTTLGIKASHGISPYFPSSIQLFSDGGIFEDRNGFLAESERRPLNAVTIQSGSAGEPAIILHSGESASSRPLATLTFPKSAPGFEVSIRNFRPGESSMRKEVVSAHGWPSRVYSFTTEVAAQEGVRPGQFEWRRTRGTDVKQLGGRREGYKLVRLDGQGIIGPRAGDGKEVVAVCATTKSTNHSRFVVRFLGTGAAGVLGERWAIMAVITALGLYERGMRLEESGAASG